MKEMKKTALLIIILIVIIQLKAQNTVQVIPQPDKITTSKGVFTLTGKTSINYKGDNQTKVIAQQLAELLSRSSGFEYEVSGKINSKSSIVFILENKKRSNDESYSLSIK